LKARWKARVELLLSVIGLIFLPLAVEALQGKVCQNSLPSGGGRSLRAKISNSTVLRAVVLTQYWRVTDRRTDGRNCRS